MTPLWTGLTSPSVPNRTRVNLHRDFTPKTYTRDQLFKIRRVYSTALPCRIFSDLRNSGMFHFRGSRAGQRNHSPSGSTNAISVCILNNNNYRSARLPWSQRLSFILSFLFRNLRSKRRAREKRKPLVKIVENLTFMLAQHLTAVKDVIFF